MRWTWPSGVFHVTISTSWMGSAYSSRRHMRTTFDPGGSLLIGRYEGSRPRLCRICPGLGRAPPFSAHLIPYLADAIVMSRAGSNPTFITATPHSVEPKRRDQFALHCRGAVARHQPELDGEQVAPTREGCTKLAPCHRLVVRADPMQNSAALDGDVRSPVARRNGDHQEAFARVGAARYCQGLDAHGLVYSVPGNRRRSLVPATHGTKTFLDRKRQVPVAAPEMFVGRRPELQQALRALRGGQRAGVLLHGQGRLGKSSLAARIADRSPDLAPAVVFGDYSARHGPFGRKRTFSRTDGGSSNGACFRAFRAGRVIAGDRQRAVAAVPGGLVGDGLV